MKVDFRDQRVVFNLLGFDLKHRCHGDPVAVDEWNQKMAKVLNHQLSLRAVNEANCVSFLLERLSLNHGVNYSFEISFISYYVSDLEFVSQDLDQELYFEPEGLELNSTLFLLRKLSSINCE